MTCEELRQECLLLVEQLHDSSLQFFFERYDSISDLIIDIETASETRLHYLHIDLLMSNDLLNNKASEKIWVTHVGNNVWKVSGKII